MAKKKKQKTESKKSSKRAPKKRKKTPRRSKVAVTANKPTAPALADYGITEAQIKKLRAGYDRNLMRAGAIGAFSTPFAPAGDLAKLMVDRFYTEGVGPDRLSARDRELALLGFFVAEPGVNFATHVYLGLMEGLTPGQIYDTAYLMALYRGADLWTGAAKTITDTFAILAAAAEGDASPTDTRAVLGALRNSKA